MRGRRRRPRQRGWEQMTKDQKADPGGDPWESRRPLIHHWAPGQGHSTREAGWKTLAARAGRPGGLGGSLCDAWILVCSPRASGALSECCWCVAGMCRQEMCADVLGLLCSGWELLILLPVHPRCLPGSGLGWSALTWQPGAGEGSAWSLSSTVPSLRPCPSCCSPWHIGF